MQKPPAPDPPGEWVGEALCGWLVKHGLPADWWHPPARYGPTSDKALRKEVADAQAVCFQCSVREQCLEYGLRWRLSGIWGGRILAHRYGTARQRAPG